MTKVPIQFNLTVIVPLQFANVKYMLQRSAKMRAISDIHKKPTGSKLVYLK